jgi:hypothetical protein
MISWHSEILEVLSVVIFLGANIVKKQIYTFILLIYKQFINIISTPNSII